MKNQWINTCNWYVILRSIPVTQWIFSNVSCDCVYYDHCTTVSLSLSLYHWCCCMIWKHTWRNQLTWLLTWSVEKMVGEVGSQTQAFFFFPSCIFVNLQKVANLNSFEICNLLIICTVQLNLHVCCHVAHSSRQKWETQPIKPESWRTSLILTLTKFSPTSHSFQSCFE